MTEPSPSADLVWQMARLSVQAYETDPAANGGLPDPLWHVLDHDELDLPSPSTPSSGSTPSTIPSPYSMNAAGLYSFGNVSTYAAVKDSMLAIVIRGSNDDDIVADFYDAAAGRGEAYLNDLLPFIDAVVAYHDTLSSKKSLIVTGHSLGGQVAELITVSVYTADVADGKYVSIHVRPSGRTSHRCCQRRHPRHRLDFIQCCV